MFTLNVHFDRPNPRQLISQMGIILDVAAGSPSLLKDRMKVCEDFSWQLLMMMMVIVTAVKIMMIVMMVIMMIIIMLLNYCYTIEIYRFSYSQNKKIID